MTHQFFEAINGFNRLWPTAMLALGLTACGGSGGNNGAPNPRPAPAPQSGGMYYDAIKNVAWLANANLAGDPVVRAQITPYMTATNVLDSSTPVINPDGTMNYTTAVNWVTALNAYNGGQGWLGHHNWQLPTFPTSPASDTTCSSSNYNNFGIQCTGSAMGNLYNVVLKIPYPNSVLPPMSNSVPPFINLQPGLYWTSDPNGNGETTWSFNTGIKGGNTTTYNFFHILPMYPGILPGSNPASGTGVVEYQSGPAKSLAVYDTNWNQSWVKDANLPAANQFNVTDTVSITSSTNGVTVTASVVNHDGAVYFSTIDPKNTSSGWMVALNNANFAGIDHTIGPLWQLPALSDIKNLYADLGMTKGDTRLQSQASVGPFVNLQPGFYWGCAPNDDGTCYYTEPASQPATTPNLYWSFNFDDGFEGTDLPDKEFYVMVYYPGQ